MISNRVEQHLINKNHQLYPLIDEYSFKSKNLYNRANYLLRQTFIITSKLNEGKEINREQQGILDWINNKVEEYNIFKENNLRKAQEKGKKLDKQFIKLDYFHANHKYPGYDFLVFLVSEGEDYKALMAQVAQQVLILLNKSWLKFF